MYMTQERCWGEGRDFRVLPMVLAADAVGTGEGTLGECQGGRPKKKACKTQSMRAR